MTMTFDYSKAAKPTMYFVGVTTGQSSIMRVFPEWARYLGLGDCLIKGIDCRLHDEPQVYREVVEFIKKDEKSIGALVTTHKIDLLAAARDMFDELDRHADLLGEVSCISKDGGTLLGHATDPITSGLALDAFLPANYWAETGAEMFLLGAGGSSLALTTYMMEQAEPGNRPARIVVANRSLPRLEQMKAIHAKINPGTTTEYVHSPSQACSDDIMQRVKPGSLVVNATGIGKDAPGSPLTDAAVFPANGIAWDFNYRGDLVFLKQARAQQAQRNIRIEDGWTYFIHGWTRVIAEVFHISIPTAGAAFDELSQIATRLRT